MYRYVKAHTIVQNQEPRKDNDKLEIVWKLIDGYVSYYNKQKILGQTNSIHK